MGATRRTGVAELVAFSSRSRGRAAAENETDFGEFYTRKSPLVNRVLLEVSKCCVIELLSSPTRVNCHLLPPWRTGGRVCFESCNGDVIVLSD